MLFFFSLFGAPGAVLGGGGGPHPAAHSRAARLAPAAALPLAFEPNVGQTDRRVRYLTRGDGYTVFLTDDAAVLALRPPDGSAAVSVRISLVGANAPAAIAPGRALPGRVNYVRGADPLKWKTNLPTFASVRYRSVYAGTDLIYHGNGGRLEYDFVLSPGADPRAIRVRFDGADTLELDRHGNLLVRIGDITLQQLEPVAYQDISGLRRHVSARYVLRGVDHVALATGEYDRTRPLVIDPVLAYATYIGGQANDRPAAIAVDRTGSTYVTGVTASTNFPVTPGALVPTGGDGQTLLLDGFVTKFNATASALVYSTYVGQFVQPFDIAVDEAGAAYLAGYTVRADFPTTPGAFDRRCTLRTPTTCDAKGFVTKLSPSGTSVVYSTFVGAPAGLPDADVAGVTDLVVDSAGNAYLLGHTGPNFPVTGSAFQPVYGGGGSDAYVAKLDPGGSFLLYASYAGGSSLEIAGGIAIDGEGNVYVTGRTLSSDFPTTAGSFQPACSVDPVARCDMAFVTKANVASGTLVYSTYLGSPSGEVGGHGTDIAADPDGNAYVTGIAETTDFPTTPGAFQTEAGGAYMNAFVTKLNPAGTALVYSTFLGGSGFDAASGIAIDRSHNAFVTGYTESPDFPLADPIQSTLASFTRDAFVTKLNASGSAPIYSTYLGGGVGICCGSGADTGVSIALDPAGDAWIAGITASFRFPTTAEAFQRVYAGPVVDPSNNHSDGFVAKIAEPCGNDLGGQLDVYTSPFSAIVSSPYLFQLQLVAIRNRTPDPIAAPLAFALTDLRNGIPLNSAGWTTCLSGETGDPFIVFRAGDDELSPGEAAWALVLFVQTQPSAIAYTPRVISRVPAI